MSALATGFAKDLLSSKKMAVLYILCSGFFWIFALGVSRNDLEKAISYWGLDVNSIRLYIGANLAFVLIFCISLCLSSLVIVAINFPFKEHQQRWYILVTFISSLYIWAYGLFLGVAGSLLSILAGLYISFRILYERKMYDYERIAERNGRSFEDIKVPMSSAVDNSFKGNNSIRENLKNLNRNIENVANDIVNKRLRLESAGRHTRKRRSEPEISERRNKYSPIFPSNHHIEADDVAYSGKVYIIKNIWLVPCGYLAGIAAISFGGIILGIISFAIPSSKN